MVCREEAADRTVCHYLEICVTVTWLSLTRKLFLLTGEAGYMDEIEKSNYNVLMGAWNSLAVIWANRHP